MLRDRTFRYRLIALVVGLVLCITMIWMMMNNPNDFFSLFTQQ